MRFKNKQRPVVIFPAHPRTIKMIKQFGFSLPKGVQVNPPVGFLDFLRLEEAARLVLTDSGGVQEECCILQVPCVTLRSSMKDLKRCKWVPMSSLAATLRIF